MTFVIGLGGRAGAGKDTLAATLRDEYGFEVWGMSDALQDAMLALDPIIYIDENDVPTRFRTFLEKDCKGDLTRAKRNPEVRRLLQVLATDVVRDIVDKNAWVRIMGRKLINRLKQDALQGVESRIIVTGIRFENELQMIHALRGRSIFVARDYTDLAEANARHVSDNSLSERDFDYTVTNNGSLRELRDNALKVAKAIGVWSL